ncbi:C39 family peptidase [Dapis sp. BLCC M126]|uniref:C39 family peptidase n=1 Tax=Dapis sp. BLCC M126 TaxID=3400189 RepID=UPI003CFB95C1
MSLQTEITEARPIITLSKELAKELQTLLNTKGHGLEVDGIVGGFTIEAFKEFKIKHYRAHYDLIGPDSIALLLNDIHSDAVNRQIERLKRYSDNPDLKTKTYYYSQRDNYRMPDRTCNSSSNAMYLDWLMRATGKDGLSGDDEYLRTVLYYGDTIYHGIQTKAIKAYGYSTKWMTDSDLPFVKDLLTTGFPVVCNILHRGLVKNPRGGHVIVLIAYNSDTFTAHDPYGTVTSNYTNTYGAYSKISESEFKARWKGGYRILA